MKKSHIFKSTVLLIIVFTISSCAYDWTRRKPEVPPEVITTNIDGRGLKLEIAFEKGKAHNHPLMAIWIEDMEGAYIQTLYVAKSIAKGYYRHGDKSTGRWKPGPLRRPATLPYWAHKRGVKEADGLFIPTKDTPMPDAITGPTPKGDFVLNTRTDDVLKQFKVLFEINQSWDWNAYWHNNKFPDDEDYKTSSQPALIYQTIIDIEKPKEVYDLEVIGHSHYAGRSGALFTDLSTITTALDITQSITVRLFSE